MENTKIALFNKNSIRKIWNDDKYDWLFSVVDVISILSQSSQPRKY